MHFGSWQGGRGVDFPAPNFRLNKEVRRRLNVIGRHPSETGCLSLVYATCKRYEVGKYGFKSNDLVHALWKRLREQKEAMITQLELALDAA